MTWQPSGAPIAPRLRPLGVGEIIDVSFRLYRSHFATFVKLAAVGVIPGQVLAFLITLSVLPEREVVTDFRGDEIYVYRAQTGFWVVIAGALLSIGVNLVAQAIAAAATTHAVAEGYLGDRKPSAGDALQAVGSMLGAVIVTALLFTLGVLGGLIACFIPGIFLATAWSVTTPALMVERVRPTAALRRSMNLVSGRWWPTFGLQILLSIIVGVLSAIITVPLTLVVLSDGVQTAGDAVIQIALQTIAALLFAPLSAIAVVILYYDLRVRKEGLDLLIQQEGLDAPTAAPPFAAPPTTPAPPSEPPPPPTWGAPPPPPPS